MARAALVLVVLVLAGCGNEPRAVDGGADRTDGGRDDAGTAVDASTPMDAAMDADAAGVGDAGRDAGSPEMDAGPPDASPRDSGPPDTGTPDAGTPDAGPAVLDVRVLADSFCDELSFDPASITVPAGTEFTVRWINATGCTSIDIDKDGTVPIVLDLGVGDSYHDTVRRWCGSLFTGTFDFRAYYSATYPFYLPVDCGG